MKLKTAKEILIGGKIAGPGNSINFKTGDWKSKKPIHNKEKCINCMRCAVYCPDMAIKVKKNKQNTGKREVEIESIDLDFCKGCGICAFECPVNAIEMKDVC